MATRVIKRPISVPLAKRIVGEGEHRQSVVSSLAEDYLAARAELARAEAVRLRKHPAKHLAES